MLIILAITVASPRIGLAATIGIIIAFNLGVAALIDRFGWFTRCKDTEGNSFGLFQSDESVTMPEGAPGA